MTHAPRYAYDGGNESSHITLLPRDELLSPRGSSGKKSSPVTPAGRADCVLDRREDRDERALAAHLCFHVVEHFAVRALRAEHQQLSILLNSYGMAGRPVEQVTACNALD